MSPSAARDGRRVPRPQLRDLGRGHPQRLPAAGQPSHPRDQPLPHPQPQRGRQVLKHLIFILALLHNTNNTDNQWQ